MLTEKDMREAETPFPKTEDELIEKIRSLVAEGDDYGKCVYSASMAACAAMNYVAGQLGMTGFQMSCADLDVIRRMRLLKGPFMLIDLSKHVYPQYDLRKQLQDFIDENSGWIQEEAQRLLDENGSSAHQNVLALWESLAKGNKR